jgi:hypothetical protein
VREAEAMNVALLGRIPIDVVTCERADSGVPVALMEPSANAVSAAFHQLAAGVRKKF